ncbi:MAG: carboxypeptidase regulatory-like domain-containing protein [Candidatus Hydrogenedentes bacterium]|nr:carboxypeptidase regulatory-like domain-containing protein [Candidatus Hydrogenedentota bacterium]
MQSNTRFYVIVIVVLVAVVGFWFILFGGNKAADDDASKPVQITAKKSEQPEPSAEVDEKPAVRKQDRSEPVGELAANRTASASSVAGDGTITGVAKDAAGDMVAGATVRILPVGWKNYEARPSDASTFETQTDNDGKFSFSKVPLKTSIGIEAELGPLYAVDSTYVGERTKTAEIELTLEQSAHIAGTVVSPEGEPVAGAALYAARWKEQAGEENLPRIETEITRQVTDESGAFRFPHVPTGSFQFLVKSDAYAPLLTDWVVSGTDDAKFSLRNGGTIAGRVVYAGTREPAGKVNVIANTNLSREGQRQESATDGSFVFSNLRDAEYRLAIESETLTLTKEPEKITLAPTQSLDGIEIEIDKGGVVSGFVRDAATSKGVRNARIQLYTESRGGGTIRTSKDATTEEDGLYTITGLPSGSYTIYVTEAEGYVADDYNKRQIISVTAGQSIEDVDFTLESGTSIAGRVVDEAGEPVPQARVSVAAKRGGRYANAESDVNGLFTVMGVTVASELFVRAEKKGLVSKPVGPFDTSSGPVGDVTITVVKEATISGVVVDESGKPIPKAQVIPYRVEKENQGFGSPVERSNEKGEFKLGRLAEGEYQLQAVIGDGSWMRNPNEEIIRVASGEEKTGVRVVVKEAGGLSIAGRVTDEDGKPVRNANIWASGPGSHSSGRTGEDGRYKIAGLKEGNFYVSVQASGYSRGNLNDIPAGSEDVDIVLKGTGKIDGKVVDAATGKPVADFEIVYGANAGASMRNFQHMGPGARTRSENGEFHIESAEAGQAALLVKAQGYAPKIQQVMDIVPGETRSGVVIELETGGVVVGRVLDTGGNPVPGAKVFDTAAPMDEYRRDRAARTTSGADGAFQLDGLPDGTVTISAYHPAYAGANVQVEVAPGRTTQADIVLGTGGTVRIRVTENGQPAAGAYAGLQDKVASDSTAKEPDANGVAEFTSVPAGNYRAYAGLRDPSGPGTPSRNQGKEIVVTDGGVTEVTLDFASGTASVVGVMAFNGQPPTRGWVQVTLTGGESSGEEGRHAETDANGQFRIENLPAGQARLRVNGMIGETNPVSRQQTVELVDGRATEVTFELGGGGTVSGIVSGFPAEGYVGVALARGNITLPARTTQEEFSQLHRDDVIVSGAAVDRATGAFTMNGIEPGQYTVCATAADESGAVRCATASVSVSEGETATVSLTLPR